MKIVLTGGGTAGHVTPNIALIPTLKKEGFEVQYIGTEKGIEKTLIEREGIAFYEIPAGKLRRYISLENLTDIGRIFKGFFEARQHLKQINPNIVFSKGGFVSCPVVWASKTLGIPVIIHESDITPGLANKLAIPFAQKICYSFPDTAPHLKANKREFTGIPVRDEILKGHSSVGMNICNFSNEKPIILIIGGSLGSAFLNSIVRENLSELLEKYQICHICGKDNMDASLNNINGYMQLEYVNEDLKDLFKMSDLVIARAGATTLYELLSLKKPNILVPLSKKASRGDQILNANFFKKEGFSEVMEEEHYTKDRFITLVEEVLKEKNKYIFKMDESENSDGIKQITELIKNTLK